MGICLKRTKAKNLIASLSYYHFLESAAEIALIHQDSAKETSVEYTNPSIIPRADSRIYFNIEGRFNSFSFGQLNMII